MAVVSHITFNNDPGSALGQIIVAGVVRDSPGLVPQKPVRTLNHYAVVYITHGGGHYSDKLGTRRRLKKGDLIFLFPGVSHTYGPGENDKWSEIFVVFEGKLFDLWQQEGILTPKNPLHHLEPVDYWLNRFKQTIWSVPQKGPDYALLRLCRFQELLADVLLHQQQQDDYKTDTIWLSQAKGLLRADFNKQLDYEAVASKLGMSYDGFRKRFRRDMGVSPARYRSLRRVDRACELLLNENLTLKNIARQLDFSDEYHFSKRFKQIIGMSPTGFRSLFKAGRNEKGKG